MKHRQLGASELQVPVVSLGSWLTYSGGVEKRQALACVHKALDPKPEGSPPEEEQK